MITAILIGVGVIVVAMLLMVLLGQNLDAPVLEIFKLLTRIVYVALAAVVLIVVVPLIVGVFR